VLRRAAALTLCRMAAQAPSLWSAAVAAAAAVTTAAAQASLAIRPSLEHLTTLLLIPLISQVMVSAECSSCIGVTMLDRFLACSVVNDAA
jgi:hypothetical protein